MDSRKNVVGRLLRSVTFRLVLFTLASGLGLWLGAGSRSTIPGRATVRRENPGKWLIADAFRFDILLARAEPATPPAVQAASPAVPAAVVVAQSEPVETVEAPMRVALVLPMPGPLRTSPRVQPRLPPQMRPASAWQVRVEGRMAHLRQTQNQLQARLTGLPAERGMTQESLQCELQRASTALETLTLDQAIPGPAIGAAAEFPAEGRPFAATPGCTY